MRIAQVVAVFPPYKGGLGTVAKEYADAMIARGEIVDIFTPNYDRVGLHWGNAGVIFSLLWKLRTYDVIHLHYPFYGSAIFTAIAARLWRKPLIITYHMRAQATGWLQTIFDLYRKVFEPFVLKSAKTIFVSSSDYAAFLPAGSQYTILPFSVDAQRFSPEGANMRAQLGIDLETRVGIFIGGMDAAHHFKGVNVLLEAIALLPDHLRGMYILIGDGDLRAQYEQQAINLGIDQHVHFCGSVSHEALPSYIRSADFHILPSIHSGEAFGIVTLEAAACGLPSIVSDLPGVRTVVDPGVTGWTVLPNSVEALRQVLLVAARAPLHTMGEAARQRVEKVYDRHVIHEALQEIYKSVNV